MIKLYCWKNGIKNTRETHILRRIQKRIKSSRDKNNLSISIGICISRKQQNLEKSYLTVKVQKDQHQKPLTKKKVR